MTLEFLGLPPSPASLPDAVEFIFGYLFPNHKAFCINPARQPGGDRGAGMIHYGKHSGKHPPFVVPTSTMTLKPSLT